MKVNVRRKKGSISISFRAQGDQEGKDLATAVKAGFPNEVLTVEGVIAQLGVLGYRGDISESAPGKIAAILTRKEQAAGEPERSDDTASTRVSCEAPDLPEEPQVDRKKESL